MLSLKACLHRGLTKATTSSFKHQHIVTNAAFMLIQNAFSTTLVVMYVERSQNTVLLASTQAVYKAPHSTVRDAHADTHVVSREQLIRPDQRIQQCTAVAVGSLRV